MKADDDFLWLATNLDRVTDEHGDTYEREGGVFRPAGLPEFEPMLEAWRRGTNRGKLRLFAAVCPGRASHALAEVYPPAPGILFTRYYVRNELASGAVLPCDSEIDDTLGRSRVEPVSGRRAETVPAAALLAELTRPLPRSQSAARTSYDHGRAALQLRCCVSASVDPRWIAAMVESGRRRAVVPSEMLSSTQLGEIEAEMDAAERDTPA